MAGSGGQMADAFISLGDKLHKNFNQTFAMSAQHSANINQHNRLMEQLKFEKDKFGLEFALQKLMSMQQLDIDAKQALLSELTNREGVKSSALTRQANEANLRKSLENEDRKKRVGKYMAMGFANAMRDNSKSRAKTNINPIESLGV